MPGLADVLPSAAAALGVQHFQDPLALGPSRHVVVVLIDGLGWENLMGADGAAPFLAALAEGSGPIDAAFPTTTPVGLGALGTGMLAGGHGLVGAAFWLPDFETMLAPLHWPEDVPPLAVQPERTVLEAMAADGVQVRSIGPAAYARSGLTRAVLRGGGYAGAESAEQRATALRSALDDASGGRSFTYVYWADLDRTGHVHGAGSEPWLAALAEADRLVQQLARQLPSGATMAVTADHGMVNCPGEARIDLEREGYLEGVLRIGGEPRMRHVYALPGAASEVAASWRERLGRRAKVLQRAECLEQGWFGPIDEAVAGRVGDVLAIAEDDTLLASAFDPLSSSLLGQHGAWTDAERLIPALVHRA